MKKLVYIFTLLSLVSLFSSAHAEMINGVPFHCLKLAQKSVIERFKKENAGRPDDIAEFKKYILSGPQWACLDRTDRKSEYFTWCDGSGCNGISAVFNGRQCVLGEEWSGQDDQDPLSDEEWRAECLVSDDFAGNRK